MQAELSALESLVVAERTPEALARAYELDEAIRAYKRSRKAGGSPSAPDASESLSEARRPIVSLVLKMPESMHADLKLACKHSGESMASVIRGLIRKHLKSLE